MERSGRQRRVERGATLGRAAVGTAQGGGGERDGTAGNGGRDERPTGHEEGGVDGERPGTRNSPCDERLRGRERRAVGREGRVEWRGGGGSGVEAVVAS